ncbi:putative ankyrin repeat protein [Dictyocoela muelleri]|nr:putative ankyrin repeat protein [Dictyocoela muelleri]
MLSDPKLTFYNPKRRMTYTQFLKQKLDPEIRNRYLFLFELQNFYDKHGIIINKGYQSNPSSYKDKKINTFQLHLLKLSIIDNRRTEPVFHNSSECFHRQNYVFLRALLNNDTTIVKFFLDNGFPSDVNSRIFGEENMNAPTYLMLAISLSNPEILSLFLKSANLRTNWIGVTPLILSACNKTYSMLLKEDSQIAYMTTSQFLVLNGKIPSYKDKPIFPIDFLCMTGDITNIDLMIKHCPKAVKKSQICFLVQSNTNIILKLLDAGINPDQNINGITPLHVAAYSNNLAAIIIFQRLGCSVIEKDNKGRLPIEYTSEITCYEYLKGQMITNKMGDNKLSDNELDNYDFDETKIKKPNICRYKKPRQIIDKINFIVDKFTMQKKIKPTGISTTLVSFINTVDEVEKSIKKLEKIPLYEFKKYEPLAGNIVFKKLVGIKKLTDEI